MKSDADIVSWNCHGLFTHSRLTALQVFADSNHPLVVSVSESHADPNKPAPVLKGYATVSKPVSTRSRGLLVFVRKDFAGRVSFRQRTDLERSDDVICIELKLPSIASPFVIAACYHHRQTSIHSSQWTSLKSTLNACSDTGLPMVAVGDFNARHTDWDYTTDPFGTDLADFCNDRSFAVLNSVFCPGISTFPSSGSVIDLAVCSDPAMFTSVCVLSDSALISDHYPICVTVASSIPALANQTPPRPRLDFKRADWEAFSRSLVDLSRSALKDCRFAKARNRDHPQTAIDTMASTVRSCLELAASLSVPAVYFRPNSKPWWNDPAVLPALDRLRSARARAYRRKASAAAKREWNTARTNWKRVVKEAKERSWNAYCERVFDPVTNQINWRKFNAATSEPRHDIGPIADDGQPLPESLHDSLNRLAQHYANISAAPPKSPEDDEILKFVHTLHTDGQDMPIKSFFNNLDDPFTESEFASICKLLTQKAPGPDGITNLLLKHAPPEFQRVLLFVFNHSWEHGVLAQDWLRAQVCPIHKG
jgi:hypothetical protein